LIAIDYFQLYCHYYAITPYCHFRHFSADYAGITPLAIAIAIIFAITIFAIYSHSLRRHAAFRHFIIAIIASADSRICIIYS